MSSTPNDDAARPAGGPPLRIRLVGRAMTETVARVPGAWRLLRGPMTRYFGGLAAGWDDRVLPDGMDHLAPLADPVEHLGLAPHRILDVGTGTGAGALWLAERFPEADVLGIDVTPQMIELARAKAPERVRFEVADAAAVVAHGPFDLVVHLNCPVLFAPVAAALAEDGTVIVAATGGSRTPFYTSHAALRRGFAGVGLTAITEGRAGAGTWLAAARR